MISFSNASISKISTIALVISWKILSFFVTSRNPLYPVISWQIFSSIVPIGNGSFVATIICVYSLCEYSVGHGCIDSVSLKITVCGPIPILHPLVSGWGEVIRSPFRKTPFRLHKSTIKYPSFDLLILAWCRETMRSSSWISVVDARPIMVISFSE